MSYVRTVITKLGTGFNPDQMAEVTIPEGNWVAFVTEEERIDVGGGTVEPYGRRYRVVNRAPVVTHLESYQRTNNCRYLHHSQSSLICSVEPFAVIVRKDEHESDVQLVKSRYSFVDARQICNGNLGKSIPNPSVKKTVVSGTQFSNLGEVAELCRLDPIECLKRYQHLAESGHGGHMLVLGIGNGEGRIDTRYFYTPDFPLMKLSNENPARIWIRSSFADVVLACYSFGITDVEALFRA